jgi:hypothetical protein
MSEPVVVVDRYGRSRTLRDDELIADGESMRVTLPMMDAAQRAVYEGTRAWRASDVRVVDARQEAYRLSVIDDTNAWRRPPGAYPLSAGEGTPCTIDGAPGHLRQAGDGSPWLECVPDEVGAAPAKTDAVSRRADAMPLKDAMQRLNDARAAAYAEVEQLDATAWTRPITSGVSK